MARGPSSIVERHHRINDSCRLLLDANIFSDWSSRGGSSAEGDQNIRTEHRLPVLLRGNRGNGADLLSWTTVLGEAGQVCEVSNLRPARNWLFFQRVGVCGSSAVQCRQHCRYMPVSCCRSCAYLDKFSDEELLFAIRFITMREFEFSKNKIQTRTICRIRHYVFASQKVTAKSNDFCTGVTRKCNALPLLVTSQKL